MSNKPTADDTAQTELETVEISHWLDIADALERLKKNKDFQKVIQDGYIKDKALDSVSLLADTAIKQQGRRPDVIEDLVAISNLQYYFMMIEQMGAGAQADLDDQLLGDE